MWFLSSVSTASLPASRTGRLFFNASDSGDNVVVALTSAEVGVDIELKRIVRRREGLARRVLAQTISSRCSRVPLRGERDALLLGLWTCKEASSQSGRDRPVGWGPQYRNRDPAGR